VLPSFNHPPIGFSISLLFLSVNQAEGAGLLVGLRNSKPTFLTIYVRYVFPMDVAASRKGRAGSDLKRSFDLIQCFVLRSILQIFEFLTKTDEGNHKGS
jgi:hypothetical protein